MITRSDWQTVNRQLSEEHRKAGEPPTPEELVAYSRGELSEEEEERVRERLVDYPELVRAIAEPFPTAGAEPGDPDYLSEHEFARHWAAMQKRMPPAKKPRAFGLSHAVAAIAATVAIVFGAFLWRAETEPSIVEEYVLYPDGGRGPGESSATLTANAPSVLHVMLAPGEQPFPSYHAEIASIDDDPRRVIWRSEALASSENESFSILLPRRLVKPGSYQVVLYGDQGARQVRLTAYTYHVPGR